MGLSSTTSRVAYTGNNTTDTYAYTFKVFAASDLLVTKVIGRVESTLILNTDYTVTGVGSVSGGNIVLTGGNLATGHKLVIRRVRPLTQTTDIRNQGTYYPETHENQFDKLVMQDQQQQDEINRSVKLPESVATSAFNPTLPVGTPGTLSKAPITNSTGTGWADPNLWPAATDIATAASSATAAAASAAAALVSENAAAASEAAAAISETNAAQSAVDAATSAASMAERDLSNLLPTAINEDLLPDTDNTRSLGNGTFNWANVRAVFFGIPGTGSGRFGTPIATGASNSGVSNYRSGSVVDGTSGVANFGSGPASGAGSSGDVNVGAGTVVSGMRGILNLLGRFVTFPSASADPSSPATTGLYYNTTSNIWKFYTGSAWSSLFNWNVVNDLTAETAPAANDVIVFGDTSASAAEKMTFENFMKVINSLTAETSVDQANDVVALFDSSASAARKMTIDNLLSGKRPIALVNRGGSGQLISNTTTTVIDWTTVSIDTNSIFDDTNNRLTPNVAGHYLVGLNINIDAGVDTAIVRAGIRKNGTDAAVGQNMSGQTGSKDNTEFIATIQYMNGSSDYFDATVTQDYGSSQNLDGSAFNTYFFCMRIA